MAELRKKIRFRQLAASLFKTIETDEYDYKEANENTVEKLNTEWDRSSAGNKVHRRWAGVLRSTILHQQLEKLLEVKEQVVTLNLNHMPVKDDELKTIARFGNLRKFNLSFTSITGKTIKELLQLKKKFGQLSLSV